MAIRTFAAIDVGSFELEMGIYEMSYKTGIRRVDHIRHVIALGKDTYSGGKISYGLVEEMCQVLGEFAQIMKAYRVKDYRAYATSAMREARNNQIILDQIRVRTGITVRIISNSEQRFISYKAIAAKAGEFNKIIQKGTAIVDVGFGSAQLSLFDKDSLVTTQNLPLGTLRVRGLLANIPATVAEHREHIEEIVDNELFTFRKMYLKDREINNLIGIGENILYIINRMDLKAYGDRIDAVAMNRFYERLCQMTTDQIEEKFGVNSEYASLLLPSVVVYKRILELTGADMFWVPGIRLCDGIAAEYAQANKLVRFSHNFENDILAASRNMAKRYKCHTSHNQVLEQYALGIFDSMKKYHGLGARERLLLQISVLLHACGKFISIKNSNECSYNIIMSTEIIGLSHLEREIIANVVRYNIRDFDYDKVQLETQIHQEDMPGYSRNSITILIAKLTAILRLANSMDRSHRGKLADCRMAVRDNELIITTGYQGNMALETASFEQKADFFEEIFGVRPVLKQKRRV
ncbi:exopolyphosphatase [Enterocloster aldenensis]|uniref:Ppx/GppA phosphatase family protein n=1 Tax=Enterocloster aldenensis TaxID=358742 RepID=UPI000E506552|nr:exopolyphosphatase [Enterocloster aldenensis]